MDRLLNRIWRINIVCCAGIAITTIYEKNSITSLLFYLSFFVTAVCMWLSLRKKATPNATKTIVIWLFIILFGLLSVLQGNLSFAYIKKFIIYIAALSSFYIASRMHTDEYTVKILLGSNLLVSVLYIVRSRVAGAYVSKTLWLFFSNPNFTGMWLYMSMVLLAVTVFFTRKKLLQCALLVLVAILGYLCLQTGTRNILFAIGYAVVLSVVCLMSKNNRFKRWMILSVDAFPLLFAFAYMFLIANNLISESIKDALVSDGKSIASRYNIWNSAFEYIKSRPIFGAYSTVEGGYGSFQLHNTHIDTWAAYGTVGLSLFLAYIYRIMKEVNDSCKTKGAMFALAGFMCMSLMGSAEAGLYATGMGMYIYVSSFLTLANYLNQKQENESSFPVDSADTAPDSLLR